MKILTNSSLLTNLSNNASIFGPQSSPSKCNMLLQDWLASAPEVMIENDVVGCVDHYAYLRSRISLGQWVSNEILSRIHKLQLAFANLRHLWSRRDDHLLTKWQFYCTAVYPLWLYGCETRSLETENNRKLLVFDYRCLRTTACVFWEHRVSNIWVGDKVLGKDGI